MKIKEQLNKKFLFIFAVLFFLPQIIFAAGPTEINTNFISSPAVWTKENSPYIIKNYLYVEDDLTIEPGTIIKFKQGAYVYFYKKLNAIGSGDEKIVFTSFKDDSFGGDTNQDGNATQPAKEDWSYIVLTPNSEANIENTMILYGSVSGFVMGALTINGTDKVTIRNSEIKYSGAYGIYIYEAQPVIERNLIANNKVGVFSWSSRTPKISYNSIVDNISGAVTNGPFFYPLDARNNWWGDKTGPYFKHYYPNTPDNLGGKGNRVGTGVYFDPWLEKDPLYERKPVILIPGIGASVNLDLMIGGIFNDNWTLFDHTYDGIIEAFKSMGFEENKDFFICYYDWRESNVESAKKFLSPLIKKAAAINNTSKVNIIAHSMGGLVARSYIQGSEYNNDVDNLIMIGTPNKGSSDVYPVWEGGYVPDNWENEMIMKLYLKYLNTKKFTFDNYESIHKFIPSIKQLLPVYDYTYPKDNPQGIKNYADMGEVNDFLINLNNGIDALNQRVKVSVISGASQNTINGIPVVSVSESPLWIDGKPDPIDPARNDLSGDGRVLLSSSRMQSLYDNVLDYDHGDIVTQSEQLIAERLKEDLAVTYPSPDIKNEMGFWFASPIEVQIKDPQGRIISKEANEIPLAKIAAETDPRGFKIVSIPNPILGEYEITIVGNGNGEYHIGADYFDYENGNNDKSSLTGGMVGEGEKKEYIINYNSSDPDNAVTPLAPKDNIPPAIIVSSPENGKPYLNNFSLNIDFEATDNLSAPENIKVDVYYDGIEIKERNIDLRLAGLGGHILTIKAEDERGNIAAKEISFSVIATVDSIIDNVSAYETFGHIYSKEVKFLETKLEVIKRLIDRIAGKENKENIINNYKKQVNRQINWLIEYIKEKSDKKNKGLISEIAKNLIIESLEFIKYK